MTLKEELQDLIDSQKEMQKITQDGITYKFQEELKHIKLRDMIIKRRKELESELKENTSYIKKLEDVISKL